MNRKSRWSKCIAAACSFVMVTSLLAGCGAGKGNSSDTKAPAATATSQAKQEPTRISIMIPFRY